jgi:hypothetical protein
MAGEDEDMSDDDYGMEEEDDQEEEEDDDDTYAIEEDDEEPASYSGNGNSITAKGARKSILGRGDECQVRPITRILRSFY